MGVYAPARPVFFVVVNVFTLYNGNTSQAIGRIIMAKRKDEREEEQDRGTKADHGIGRPDAEVENTTKADLPAVENTTKADLLDTATVPQFQEGADIADPVHTEGADLLDTATVPQFQEGGHHILASLAQPRSSCLRV